MAHKAQTSHAVSSKSLEYNVLQFEMTVLKVDIMLSFREGNRQLMFSCVLRYFGLFRRLETQNRTLA
jgi:hypothetical protein